jgi:hypothetical protein
MPDNAKVKGRSAESSPVALRNVIGDDGETAQDAMWSFSLLTHRQICPVPALPANRFMHAKVNTVPDGIGCSNFKTTEELSKLDMMFENDGIKLHVVDAVRKTKFVVKTMVMLSPV